MDEDKLGRATSRALAAENLLNSDMLKEAFDELERAYIEKWRTSIVDDVTGREKLFLAINVIGKVKQHLQAVVNDGKMAQAQLAELAANEERKKRYGIF